jgi:hypothetical protein
MEQTLSFDSPAVEALYNKYKQSDVFFVDKIPPSKTLCYEVYMWDVPQDKLLHLFVQRGKLVYTTEIYSICGVPYDSGAYILTKIKYDDKSSLRVGQTAADRALQMSSEEQERRLIPRVLLEKAAQDDEYERQCNASHRAVLKELGVD